MLENTFCHINGIGPKTEARLWEAGIWTWADFAAARPAAGRAGTAFAESELQESYRALQDSDPAYFFARLSSGHHWRLFADFKNTAAYIDIETTGLGSDSRITTIALYDGTYIRTYVNGINLEQFLEDIACYDLLITYNGKTFDLPFIERFFGIRLPQAHVDLRYVLRSLGYKGGLKGCEKSFGLDRKALDGVDGYFAVLLWQQYEKTSDPRVLETLLAYNTEDVVNLEYLMHSAYNLKLGCTPFAGRLELKVPKRPAVPFAPDAEILYRLKRTGGFSESSFGRGVFL